VVAAALSYEDFSHIMAKLKGETYDSLKVSAAAAACM